MNIDNQERLPGPRQHVNSGTTTKHETMPPMSSELGMPPSSLSRNELHSREWSSKRRILPSMRLPLLPQDLITIWSITFEAWDLSLPGMYDDTIPLRWQLGLDCLLDSMRYHAFLLFRFHSPAHLLIYSTLTPLISDLPSLPGSM